MRADEALLLDMLIASRRSIEFTATLTYSEFEQSELYSFAVLKSLEIVGEAASKISEEKKSEHPEIPWTDIIGFRNRLVHAYFGVDLALVWEIVQHRIPELIQILDSIVPTEAID